MKVKTKTNNIGSSGFTILELLVVMTIIGILAVLGIGGFRSAQIKSRDSKRKNDLVAIAKSLEIYYNDKGRYPEANPSIGGEITGATWGGSFSDPSESSTIYMAEFPEESISANTYYYWSDSTTNNQSYQLYARLENLNDKVISYDAPGTDVEVADGYDGVSCGTSLCNFGVSSQNITSNYNRILVDAP